MQNFSVFEQVGALLGKKNDNFLSFFYAKLQFFARLGALFE
jgi:hypothetical protein